ncbi:hypothetical protein F6B43_18210 [Microbacterium rhizomatis]|uniref:Uncharacterized protein n=2 Tax=Microbacterium rhizomatis TaxID=1631477 RepID=A0A5J5IWL1_9MICO|nr:hypothetical protein F6B43_18210 [Microbacterium rhizomatis]
MHPSQRRSRPLPALATRESLEQLPTRMPPSPAVPSSALQWQRIGVDRYQVRIGTLTLGYIDVVGAVFVVLAGSRYSRAVETAQTLVFEDAVNILRTDAPES